jgi:hypothetical protein
MSTSLRFICSFSDDELKLIRMKRLEMIALPSLNETDRDFKVGTWIELRTSEDRQIYTRIIHDHLDEHVEILTGKLDEPLAWQKSSGLERIIVILVPDLADAVHLVVISKKPGDEKGRAQEIARFPVKL